MKNVEVTKDSLVSSNPSGRGVLTDSVESKLATLYNIEVNVVTRDHLRFLPYLEFTLINSKTIDKHRINDEEAKLLQSLINLGHVWYVDNKVYCSSKFYMDMMEILYESYVSYIYFDKAK